MVICTASWTDMNWLRTRHIASCLQWSEPFFMKVYFRLLWTQGLHGSRIPGQDQKHNRHVRRGCSLAKTLEKTYNNSCLALWWHEQEAADYITDFRPPEETLRHSGTMYKYGRIQNLTTIDFSIVIVSQNRHIFFYTVQQRQKGRNAIQAHSSHSYFSKDRRHIRYS